MSKKIDKRFILSDESLNSYGYWVLTSGGLLERFTKNPVMLWMHFRDEGCNYWGESKPIGHWEDIKVEDGVISAVPVFDLADELSQLICKKVEEGTINATSIGLRILATSQNKDVLKPGQTRETVTEWELLEASFVDIPANANAVRLYGRAEGTLTLSLKNDDQLIPQLPNINHKPMKLKETFSAVLSFLGIPKEKASETELTEDQLSSLNAEMERLRADNDAKQAELAKAKSDLANAKSQHQTELATKDQEIATLKATETALAEQVKNLKNSPTGSPDLHPGGEPADDQSNDVDQFLANAAKTDDYNSVIAEADKLGLLD